MRLPTHSERLRAELVQASRRLHARSRVDEQVRWSFLRTVTSWPARLRLALALGGLGSVVAAVLIVAILTGIGARPSHAYASWTAVPETLSSIAARKTEMACETAAKRLLSQSEHARRTGAPTISLASEWRGVINDLRGRYVTTMLQAEHGRGVAICLSKLDAKKHSSVTYTATGVGPIPQIHNGSRYGPSATRLTVLTSGTGRRDQSAFSYIAGRAGSGVEAVTITLKGGGHVQATVHAGWFLAWWPGSQPATAEHPEH